MGGFNPAWFFAVGLAVVLTLIPMRSMPAASTGLLRFVAGVAFLIGLVGLILDFHGAYQLRLPFASRKVALVELEQSQQWSPLTKEQIDSIATDLRARGIHSTRILACPTADCQELADDFSKVFAKAGWQITEPKRPLNMNYTGIQVSVTKESLIASEQLAEVLRQHGYEVGLWGDPEHQTTTGTSAAWLLIGPKGRPTHP